MSLWPLFSITDITKNNIWTYKVHFKIIYCVHSKEPYQTTTKLFSVACISSFPPCETIIAKSVWNCNLSTSVLSGGKVHLIINRYWNKTFLLQQGTHASNCIITPMPSYSLISSYDTIFITNIITSCQRTIIWQ